MIGSIKHLAEAIKLDLFEALPFQRKTQKENLALLVAQGFTLEVRIPWI
jgi:hypothetical protein